MNKELKGLLDNYYHERYMTEERGKGDLLRAENSLDKFLSTQIELAKKEGYKSGYSEGRKDTGVILAEETQLAEELSLLTEEHK